MCEAKSLIITNVEVTERRNDKGLLKPMLDIFEKFYKKIPKNILVDSNYPIQEDLISINEKCDIHSQLIKEKTDIKPESLKRRKKRQEKEHKIIKKWRARVVDKEKLKRRQVIETINAIIKNRKNKFFLRSKTKAKIELILSAFAHNISRMKYLGFI